MAERLFVYGTLHPQHAPNEIADVVRRFKRLGEGTVHGRLYDLGDFPAMVLDQTAGKVNGEVFIIPTDSNALARLDAYEEYHPSDPKQSLFLRQKTTVDLADGTKPECWVYVYNKSLLGHRPQPQFASVA